MKFAAAARLVKRESDSMLKRMDNPIISTKDSDSKSSVRNGNGQRALSIEGQQRSTESAIYIWQEHMMISAFHGISFSCVMSTRTESLGGMTPKEMMPAFFDHVGRRQRGLSRMRE